MAFKINTRDLARMGVRLPPRTPDAQVSCKGMPAPFMAKAARRLKPDTITPSVQDDVRPHTEWIEVALHGTPAIPKERQRFGAGKVYTSTRTRTYERRLKSEGVTAMGNRPPLRGPVETEVIVRFAIPASWPQLAQDEARTGLRVPTRKGDWDNLAKAATDSLNAVVYEDDSQIVRAHVIKVYADDPGITVRFRNIPGVKGGWKRA